jgi:hypothetical protein
VVGRDKKEKCVSRRPGKVDSEVNDGERMEGWEWRGSRGVLYTSEVKLFSSDPSSTKPTDPIPTHYLCTGSLMFILHHPFSRVNLSDFYGFHS